MASFLIERNCLTNTSNKLHFLNKKKLNKTSHVQEIQEQQKNLKPVLIVEDVKGR